MPRIGKFVGPVDEKTVAKRLREFRKRRGHALDARRKLHVLEVK